VWNSAQYQNPAYDQAFKNFQASVGVDEQKKAAKAIEELLLDDSPTLFPYFFNYLAAHSKKFDGIRLTALGHLFLDKAGQV
jgi:peptide/nickel transport system substrate-binding protein